MSFHYSVVFHPADLHILGFCWFGIYFLCWWIVAFWFGLGIFYYYYFAIGKGFFFCRRRGVVIHIHEREVFPAPAHVDKDFAVSHSKLSGIVWGLPDQIRANSKLIRPVVRLPLPNNFPNCHFDKAVIR